MSYANDYGGGGYGGAPQTDYGGGYGGGPGYADYGHAPEGAMGCYDDPNAGGGVGGMIPAGSGAKVDLGNYGKGGEACPPLSAQSLEQLKMQGYPQGLASALWENAKTYSPYRIWVVDNSGSMKCDDGHLIRSDPRKHEVLLVKCTRWDELKSAVEYHASLAGALQLNTTFRMLNDPGFPNADQEFSIGGSKTAIQQDVHRCQAIMRMSQPNGVTPLTAHIMEICALINQIRYELEEAGQIVVVVLATDGLPSDSNGNSTKEVTNEFMAALQELQKLPVWIVVRLCTDDPGVSNFYNKLDLNLEMPLEVLDDLFAEGRQVCANNDWLNYAMPLHRCREMGFRHRLFDLLDERQLNKDEVREFLELLFGNDKLCGAPDIHMEFKGFIKFITDVVKSEDKQWNPLTKKSERWINVKKLEKTYKGENKIQKMIRGQSARFFGK